MVIVAIESHQGAIDMQVTTIGLDIAKNCSPSALVGQNGVIA